MSLKDSFLYTDLCKRLAIWPDAITPEQLLVELEKAEASGFNFRPEHDLLSAFYWASSPQGNEFWYKLWFKAYPPDEE